jgi:predicted nucleotidyltransferase
MRLDSAGYIIPEADLGKVQLEYRGVPQAAAEVLLEQFGYRLHSGYLYGSVVRGNAVPGRSDLDILVVLRAAPTNMDQAAAECVAAVLRKRYPVLADVGVGWTHIDEVMSTKERYALQVFLRDLSVCISGEDLRSRLPRTRPGAAVAAGFHRNTPAVLARTRAELSTATDPDVIRRACRLASRRMVQAAFAVVMARDGVWATVLERQAALVGHAFPEWAQAARRAAEHGRQPVADPDAVGDLLATFGRWIEEALNPLLAGRNGSGLEPGQRHIRGRGPVQGS